jgi:hypothetical protein
MIETVAAGDVRAVRRGRSVRKRKRPSATS